MYTGNPLIDLLQAIEALNAATRVKPVPPLFMLLGKTQMKAKVFKDAITSFDRALQLYVSFCKSVIFVVVVTYIMMY